MRHIVSSLTLLSCAVLTACGGGGGGSSTPTVTQLPLTTLSSSNYQTVAGSSVSGTKGVMSSAQYTSILTGVDGNISPNWARFSLEQLSRLPGLFTGAATLQGITQTQTQACNSGRVIVTVTDQNGNQQPDAGDSMSMVFEQCFSTATNSTMSGTMTFVINTTPTGDLASPIYSFDASLGFSNVSIATGSVLSTANGTLRVASTRTGLNLGFDSISTAAFVASTSAGGQTDTSTITEFNATENYSAAGTSSLLNGIVGSTSMGGSVSIRTTSPLLQNYNTAYPYAGRIVMTGAGNAQAIVNVNNQNSVTVQFDATGDGIIDQQQTLAWSAL
ncbi:MAG: hypothetical protein RJA44_788 [Pseudomonadota bacterium]